MEPSAVDTSNGLDDFAANGHAHARAWFLGARIDLRKLAIPDALAQAPLTVRAGRSGRAMLFRYGAIVIFGVDSLEERTFIDQLMPLISEPFAQPQTEEIDILIDAAREERMDSAGTLILHDAGLERLQVVANVLARSTVLEHYENQFAVVFEQMEPIAGELRLTGRVAAEGRDLLRQVGSVLLAQTRMVGRVEVAEKPEVLWDRPDLDRLYERLNLEYELRDRDHALARKLDLVGRAAETVLDIYRHRQELRVEWYIVILIVVEIILFCYQLFGS